MTKPRVVLIVWEDATMRDQAPWVEAAPWKYAARIVTTVGWVLYEGKEGIVLTDSLTDGMTGPVQQIPRKMIISKEYLTHA